MSDDGSLDCSVQDGTCRHRTKALLVLLEAAGTKCAATPSHPRRGKLQRKALLMYLKFSEHVSCPQLKLAMWQAMLHAVCS